MADFRSLSICLALVVLLGKSTAQEYTSSNIIPMVQGFSCGTVAIRPRPLIAYGQATEEGEFPWHAALYYIRNSNLSYICGGSLISSFHLVTAAHCATRPRTNIPVHLDNLIIYLGQHYYRDFSNSSVQQQKVASIVPHPQYNAQNYANDIALITFTAPARITDYVRPICLWQESSELTTVINKLGTIVGWGYDETGMVSKKLRQAKMPVVSNGKCTLSFPDFFLRFLSSNSFCAGFQNGTAVCNGDSGGGLVFRKANSNPDNPTWQLRGLVSIGPALQSQNKCDLRHYTIFTDVAAYLDWIWTVCSSSGTWCSTSVTTEASLTTKKSTPEEWSPTSSESPASSTPNPLQDKNLDDTRGTVIPIVVKNGTQTFERWAKPPVVPVISIYLYNVTNFDEFLNNGSKPIVDEVGPYIYKETWERKNIKFNENGTVTYNLQKIFVFDEENSTGMEDDLIVVPNIPMLRETSRSKHAARFLKRAMASIMDILQIKPFVEVPVGQLLWGYEDPLLKFGNDVRPWEFPDKVFGLMYNKNGTSPDNITIFTGANDITKYGLMDTFNGKSHLNHWLTDECNSLLASDGSIFPPQITKNKPLYIYDKDLCRTLPLKFEKEVERKDKVPSWRFSPPEDVFASVTENPDNLCFCPHGPPCSPSGLFNVSLCRLDSPVMLSFPHFYLANDSYRTAFEGISPPDPEKHTFYIDVQPLTGTAMSARSRIQINLAVSQDPEIKQVATFPDTIFPIMWFEESVDGLPDEVTHTAKRHGDEQ